ncbi:putative methyltransferase [Hordeum vulgare]|nr:putative methyltransferase [Hordeum vulgare]
MASGAAAAARRLLLLRHRRRHLVPNHHFSSSSAGEELDGGRVKIFDRDLKCRHRDRAAWAMRETDPLVDAVADNLLDRLEDCRKAFPSAFCLGGSAGAVRRSLRGRGGIEKLTMMDMSVDMVNKWRELESATDDGPEMHFIVGDEEYLPIKENSQDLIMSCLGLHWTNDLPGAMIQCRLALKPDGLFLAAILGGETLKELRIACTIAQMEREGGISPRMSPLAQVRDAGNLLSRAGFALPGVDVDRYTVKYNSALELVEHLRAMAETNALFQRSPILKRDTALATAAIYQSMFGLEDGTIPATFQVSLSYQYSADCFLYSTDLVVYVLPELQGNQLTWCVIGVYFFMVANKMLLVLELTEKGIIDDYFDRFSSSIISVVPNSTGTFILGRFYISQVGRRTVIPGQHPVLEECTTTDVSNTISV